jgi:Dolichyl-phosphate-mannose-protein mannosyltransferase
LSVGERRAGLALLAIALLAASVLALQDLDAPWENSFKGVNGGAYAMRCLQNHLELGLGVTLGGNMASSSPLDGRPIFYLNHPGTYALLHLGPAAVFGLSEAVMRVVGLLLWLPAIPAFWWIARRLLGEPVAGVGALLLACTSMTAYYGPMTNTDGALLAGMLTLAAAFLAHVERPTRRTGVLVASALVYSVLMDWSAVWLAPMLAVLASASADPPRARRLALLLVLLALLPTAVLLAHTCVLRGGVESGLETWWGFLSFSQAPQEGRGPLHVVVVRDALALYRLPLLSLAGAGLLAGLLAPRAWGLRPALWAAGALALPGVLHVLAFRGHARVHDYWSIAATPGVVLAALLPLAAARRAASTGRAAPRVALLAAAAACAWAAWDGAQATSARTTLSATTFYRDVGQELNLWFGPGDVVATSFQPASADAYARADFVGPVETPAKLKQLRRGFAPPAFKGRLAFLLPNRERDSPLGRALARLATPEVVTNGLLFRLQP